MWSTAIRGCPKRTETGSQLVGCCDSDRPRHTARNHLYGGFGSHGGSHTDTSATLQSAGLREQSWQRVRRRPQPSRPTPQATPRGQSVPGAYPIRQAGAPSIMARGQRVGPHAEPSDRGGRRRPQTRVVRPRFFILDDPQVSLLSAPPVETRRRRVRSCTFQSSGRPAAVIMILL